MSAAVFRRDAAGRFLETAESESLSSRNRSQKGVRPVAPVSLVRCRRGVKLILV